MHHTKNNNNNNNNNNKYLSISIQVFCITLYIKVHENLRRGGVRGRKRGKRNEREEKREKRKEKGKKKNLGVIIGIIKTELHQLREVNPGNNQLKNI